MNGKYVIGSRLWLSGLLVLSLMACTRIGQAQVAPPFTTLHSFNGTDGANPTAALLQGHDGSFYGTTYGGGLNGLGTVFKIAASGVLSTLYSFGSTTSDGANPHAQVILGKGGALYGTTWYGGAANAGTVFKITPAGTLTLLHAFDGNDGAYPVAGLLLGKDGAFYGTTAATVEANFAFGTIFKITAAGALTTLHTFHFIPDGAVPLGELIQGKDGALYGTSSSGGNDDWAGTVFQITPSGAFNPLYAFSGTFGASPDAGLVQGKDGNLYGTSSGNGWDDGAVFKITTTGVLTPLYSFSDDDGSDPEAPLLQGNDGAFYGTTQWGGDNGTGTVFKITTEGALTTLYSFSALDSTGNNADGANPVAGLIHGKDGNLYSTTQAGGSNGVGTVFKLTMTPVITRFSPTKGPVGTSITLTGANFTEAINVLFGNVYVAFKVNSDTSLTFTVPGGAPSARITVYNPFGKGVSKTAFKVTP